MWNFRDETQGQSTELVETAPMNKDLLNKLSSHFNVEIQKDDKGDYAIFPSEILNGISSAKGQIPNFIDFWLGKIDVDTVTEQSRRNRYSMYQAMSQYSMEALLMLDAYADESLGVGFTNEPISVIVNDNELQKKLNRVLERNNILDRARGTIRNLCKWGDMGYHIRISDNKKITNEEDKIVVSSVLPIHWEIQFLKTMDYKDIPVSYKKTDILPGLSRFEDESIESYLSLYGKKNKKKSDRMPPWELVQVSLYDEEYSPYGKSILEPLRVSYDQLSTIEALLALSRASRIDRLLIKVPAASNNPVAAMQQVNNFKGQYKNLIFNDSSGGKKAHGKANGLNDVMFMPNIDKFEIDRIQSSMDISSTEDAEYFRDKMITATGLPKGYFLADEVTDRGNALANQDLKFVRKLIPIQKSFAKGLTNLCTVLLTHLGADWNKVEVKVEIKRPTQISRDIIESYTSITRAASDMFDSYLRAVEGGDETPNKYKPATKVYQDLLIKMGMPKDIAKLFHENDNVEDKISEDISKALSESIVYSSSKLLGIKTMLNENQEEIQNRLVE